MIDPTSIQFYHDMPDLSPEEGARLVRQLLVQRGWNKGAFIGQNGSFCLAGAIRYTYAFSRDFNRSRELIDRIQNLLRKRNARAINSDKFIPSSDQFIGEWNDDPRTEWNDVLQVLRSVERGYGKDSPKLIYY